MYATFSRNRLLCWWFAGVSLMLSHLGSERVMGQTPYGGFTVQFASSSYTVDESAGKVELTVTLSSSTAGVVTVNYATSNGTAVAGTDYRTASGTLTFAPGVTSQKIGVGILDNDNYSKKSLYFTAELSQPSSNATLAAPSTTTVNVLDNDPAPKASIEIDNVPEGKKNDPGGYVQVNANNDNGSVITYANLPRTPIRIRKKTGRPISPGIPRMRDFDPKNVNLAKADPDLFEVILSPKNLKIGGPETISLSVKQDRRARIQLWQTAKKPAPAIQTPATWTAANMPKKVFVEGLLESAALREVILTLQIWNKKDVVSTDTCTLTVTPVLTNFVVTATPGTAPDLANDVTLGRVIDSSAGGGGKDTFTTSATAQWNKVRGELHFIQNLTEINKLPNGWGANLGPIPFASYIADYPAPNTGKPLADPSSTAEMPFILNSEDLQVAGGVATNSVVDNPCLPLDMVNDVTPAVGNKTTLGVTDSFVSYATVAFADDSLYCLGQQAWRVRYAGAVTQSKAGTFKYEKFAKNANKGSDKFAAGVRNNANPAAIGPENANVEIGWR